MRISKIKLCLSMFLALLTSLPSLWGQQEIQQIPPFVTYDGANADLVHPFIDPMAFDPDFQFFAPVEIGEYGGRPQGPVGFFAEYNRMYINVSRPQAEQSNTEGDFTWGNRIDLGYMSDEKHGWWFSHVHINNPNSFDVQIVERVNRFDPDDEVNGPPTTGGGGGGGGGGAAAASVFPVRDRNDPRTQARDFFVQQSLNSANLVGFDLNKTFRVDPLHYGSTIEPFFGFRYNKFRDFFRRENYDRFDEDTGGIIGPFPPPPDFDVGTIEQLTTLTSNWDNHMVGGQLGLRWFTQKSRWNLSGDVRAFALQNFQNFNSQTNIERTFYDGADLDATVLGVLSARTGTGGHAGEFVVGTEIRAEAAFQLTRDIRFNTGFQFMDFGRGIARGNSLTQNDEDLLMAGITFGAEINR